VSSRNEARRLITQGAVKLNGEKLTDPEAKAEMSTGDLLEVGKKRAFRISD